MYLYFQTFWILLIGVSVVYGSDDRKTVDELIRSSLKNHPSIAFSKQIVVGAGAGVDGAKWGYFPTPSVDVSLASGRRGTTLRLDQPLWTGGKLDAALSAAEARKAESEQTLEETSYVLVSNLLILVRNYVQAEESLSALEDGKMQLLELKAMMERRIEAGASSLSDGELIRSRLSQIETELTVARTNRSLALHQIEIVTGVDVRSGIVFENAGYLDQKGEMGEIIGEMKGSHPMLKKIDAQIKTAEADRDRAKAAVWPNLALRAEHQSGSVYYDNATSDNIVYLAVTASTGAGLSALSNIQSAESTVLQKQFEKQVKEKELIDGLIRDYNDYHSAKARMADVEQTIGSSTKVLESYKRLFLAGKRQWLDLVNSSRELTQNKLAVAELKATLAVSAYQLALKRGKITLLSGDSQ